MDALRWYVGDPLSYRNLEKIMDEGGLWVDHWSNYRWAIR